MRAARPTATLLQAALAAVLVACSGGPVTTTPGITSQEVLTPAPFETGAPTAAGTPTEVLATPATLDRELGDSELTRQSREQLVRQFVTPTVTDARVLAAMRAVPRHAFVPRDATAAAYGDFPLPIGYGQTISQPSLVAEMTELLQVDEGDRVLEIGTGSGYQAAILAELTDEVYTVEIIPELAATARAVLDALGYRDIRVRRADGYFGWREHAPYDAIVVTAAPDHLPNPLVQQLKPDGGRMVIPIGPVGDVQTLWLVTRQSGKVDMERVTDVRFVPFTRQP
jgi:protein-L-isoaspartate(D-aspartate) O-methyltransferase